MTVKMKRSKILFHSLPTPDGWQQCVCRDVGKLTFAYLFSRPSKIWVPLGLKPINEGSNPSVKVWVFKALLEYIATSVK